MKCKKHPRYLARREPTSNCRACWRVFVVQEVARQLATAHKAAVGQMVEIDVGSLKNEKGPVEILRDLRQHMEERLQSITDDPRFRAKPALVHVNAPLALIQCIMKGEYGVLEWALQALRKEVPTY